MFITDATSLPRVMACNGSPQMVDAAPKYNFDTQARDEGIAAHYMAFAAFIGTFTVEEMIDRKAPNGFYMTNDMANHVHDYLSTLDCGEMEVETSFATERWQVRARCDHRKYNVDTDTLTINDLKYGYSAVEPENNWTLIAHAIGTCIGLNITPARIVLTINQPRGFHRLGRHRSWVIDYATLMQFYAMIDATLSNLTDELRTGPQCNRCPALLPCPAARRAELNAIDVVDTVFVDTIGDDVLSYELDTLRYAADVLKNRLTAFEELAEHRVRNGKIVENYSLERKYGNRAWLPGLTPEFIKLTSGVDVSKKGFATPAEAIRRGMSEETINKITHRPETGAKLVRISANEKAKRLFGTR